MFSVGLVQLRNNSPLLRPGFGLHKTPLFLEQAAEVPLARKEHSGQHLLKIPKAKGIARGFDHHLHPANYRACESPLLLYLPPVHLTKAAFPALAVLKKNIPNINSCDTGSQTALYGNLKGLNYPWRWRSEQPRGTRSL